ncbi:hypothetical protein JOC85_001826 [Bacillus mesophilus]|uniref:DUF3951 domain-containing protein n=1 Tax=Bacillus mesophilus TaxID=1808955 RepID=A0A6M0Q7I5_9BACI|nr:hypothetical protein [Bacillus mesophilus]MBM7661054.1 hypothetical protein [Bacillus mesophilus]NEY71410.1 hypothetical protein [Bacillus mesophilus]
MTFIFLVFLLAIIALITIKTMKNKRFPSNNYTPFDNIVSGKNEESLSHHTHYQEEKKEL